MAKKMHKKKHLNERLKTLLWFLIKFNLLAIPLYIILFLNLSYEPLQSFFASITYGTLKLFNYNVAVDSYRISVLMGDQLVQIDISWDSTGWKSLYALFALVIATPISTYNKKLRFLLIGLPAIFVLNFIRILTTILISLNFGFQYFDIVHTILWREGLILAVVGIWYYWLWKEKVKINKK